MIAERFSPLRSWMVFFRLHPLNVIPAWVSSFFRPVAYWKADFVGGWLTRRFIQMSPENVCERGQMEWNAITADAYDACATRLPSDWSGIRFVGQVDGRSVDFTSVAILDLTVEFEARYQFAFLINKWIDQLRDGRSVSAVQPHFDFDSIISLPEFEAEWNEFDFVVNARLDRAWEKLYVLLKIATAVIRTLSACFRTPRRLEKHSFFWQDISFNEMAEGPNQYDFSFLVQRELFKGSEILYLLPVQPNAKARNWLESNNIHWVLANNLGGWIPRSKVPSILCDLLRTIMLARGIDAPISVRHRVALYVAQGILLFHVLKAQGVTTLITSASGHETSAPINAISQAAGIRTIIWQYAQAGTMPLRDDGDIEKGFGRKRLVQSVIQADEQWVWYQFDRKLLVDRCLQPPDYAPRFYTTGPVMAGDSNWLKKTPNQARKDMGVSGENDTEFLWVGIFDVDTKSVRAFASNRSGPNRFPLQMQAQFFSDISAALSTFCELRIFYKPKRRVAADKFVRSRELLDLIDPEGQYVQENRIVCLDTNVDPYIPIAMSDCVVGAPYTSGVLVSSGAGRPSVYYDPLGWYSSCYPPLVNQLKVDGRDALFAQISSWIQGDRTINQVASHIAGEEKDPAYEFSRMLRQGAHTSST